MATSNVTATDSTRIEDRNATVNYSSQNVLQVGQYSPGGGFIDHSLLHFNLTGIPSNATVTSATLKMYDQGTNLGVNTRTMRVYRMIRAWTYTQATWNIAVTGTNWGTAGASNTTTDREATDIGSISMPGTEVAGYVEISLTASKVQEWIAGTFTNNGIQLKMDTESSDMHQFSDETVSGQEPVMVVNYTTPGYNLSLMGVGK